MRNRAVQPQRNRRFSHTPMPSDEMEPVIARPKYTGRLLILFNNNATEAGMRMLQNTAGLQVALADQDSMGALGGGATAANSQALVYATVGVAVASADPDQMAAVSAASSASNSPILTTELEREVELEPIVGVQQDEEQATWGLDLTGVIRSTYSGKGIKIAILDTGFTLNHPDFSNRKIISHSFVDGEAVDDEHGHGTHCTGTACGPRSPGHTDKRYGIAYEADIYIGKVLNNQGAGKDNTIIAGINWAVEQGCHLISMSIGGAVSVGASYSDTYEIVAQRARKAGTLIIAAAGNNSHRSQSPSVTNPVSRPANCPSILAVGALDRNYQIATFSNGGINVDADNGNAASVDIVGPGVDVYSSWKGSKIYHTISGTSMATPHVAGIAALYAQASGKRGQDLWDQITERVRRLELSKRDGGAGFVQAPGS